jgi:uncharacterized protein YdaU (DUF1376 family)
VAADHYLPLFVGDFAASTAAFDGYEAGVYLLLLIAEWSSGPLPKDVKKLAKISRLSQHNFKKIWEIISDKFVEKDGKLINLRLEAVRAENARIQAERSKAGRIGGLASAHSKRQAKVKQPFDLASSKTQPPIRSDPSLTSSEDNTRSSTRADFEAFRDAYPRGAYTHSAWLAAEREFARVIEEEHVSPDELTQAAVAYYEQQKAKGALGSQFVRAPLKFLQQGFWKGPFPLPVETNGHASPAGESAKIYDQLIKSRGAEPKRTAKIQAAIDAVGGWLSIETCTSFEAAKVKRDFCAALDAQG